MEASSSRTGSVSAQPPEPEIPGLLLKFDDALAAYVREPLPLPRWLPRTTWADGPSWTEAEIASMPPLYFPETPFGDDKPDMLLYELGNLAVLDEAFPARLADFVSGEDHLLLVERSGAGKTRLVFETLCHHWGLYFTCSSDSFVSPYGSHDIKQAIHRISVLDIEQVLYPLNPRSRILRDKLHKNQAKIRTLVAGIVLARLFVFHLFQRHAKASNLTPGDARKKWLILQLRPHLVFGRTDIFVRLMDELRGRSYETLARDIRRLQLSSAAVLEFVAVDEAQVAGSSYAFAFTSPDRRSYRSFLSQLILDLSFICSKQRLIVSGVEGSCADMQDAIRASGSNAGVRQFLDLGMFGTLERVHHYLDHFGLSDQVDRRTVFQWLGGRHRVLAVFTAYYLLAGQSRWRSVLSTMLHKLTGWYDLGDPLIDEISLSALISRRLLEDTQAAWTLRHALYRHGMLREPTVTVRDHASSIVTLALARYGSDTSTTVIDEQLVFLSLYKWLIDSPGHSFWALLGAAQSGSLRYIQSAGFLESLALVLWDAHVKQMCMDLIFKIVGQSAPWTNTLFQLVLPHLSSRTCSPPAADVQASHLIASAHSPEELAAWFHSATCPFLIPDEACGVEMLCMVRLDVDHILLLCFETEKRVLSSLLPRTRLTPTHPSSLYAQVSPSHRK